MANVVSSQGPCVETHWLFALVPQTPLAWHILELNPNRVVMLSNHGGPDVKALGMYLNNLTIGRNTTSGIVLPQDIKGFSRTHCSFHINISSGEIVLLQEAKAAATIVLDDQELVSPAYAAFIFGEAKDLAFGDVGFAVRWPRLADAAAIKQHRLQKRQAAIRRQFEQDPEVTDYVGQQQMTKTQKPEQTPDKRPVKNMDHGLPPFKLEALGGTQNDGVAYLAVRRDNADLVIVKEVRADIKVGPDELQIVHHGLNLLCGLVHPNIHNMHSWNRTNHLSQVELVLEYVPESANNLQGLVGNRTWCMEHGHTIFTQLCNALVYLHSQNIVHEDIRPDKILVIEHADGTVNVKLANAGTARIADRTVTVDATRKEHVRSLGRVIEQMLGAQNPSNWPCCWMHHPSHEVHYFRGNVVLGCPVRPLLQAMIAERPDDRPDAASCLELLRELSRRPRRQQPVVPVSPSDTSDVTMAEAGEVESRQSTPRTFSPRQLSRVARSQHPPRRDALRPVNNNGVNKRHPAVSRNADSRGRQTVRKSTRLAAKRTLSSVAGR